jgi:hypothetical protein
MPMGQKVLGSGQGLCECILYSEGLRAEGRVIVFVAVGIAVALVNRRRC